MENFHIVNNYNNLTSIIDRLNVLKFIKPKTKKEKIKIDGEIKYITSLIQAQEFSSHNDYKVI
jgi:hypothetical protein